MLAANPKFDIGTDLSALLSCYPYESTHPFGVKNLEGVVGKNTPINVRGKEPPRIVAAQAEGRLRQVICSEREELR